MADGVNNGASLKHLYSTSGWRQLRAAQLAAEPLCRMCLEQDIVTVATVCDHVEPHRGNVKLFWSGPFQSLCASHHSGEKQRIEKGGTPRQAIGVDGWPVASDADSRGVCRG